jgi:hypothetical protein
MEKREKCEVMRYHKKILPTHWEREGYNIEEKNGVIFTKTPLCSELAAINGVHREAFMTLEEFVGVATATYKYLKVPVLHPSGRKWCDKHDKIENKEIMESMINLHGSTEFKDAKTLLSFVEWLEEHYHAPKKAVFIVRGARKTLMISLAALVKFTHGDRYTTESSGLLDPSDMSASVWNFMIWSYIRGGLNTKTASEFIRDAEIVVVDRCYHLEVPGASDRYKDMRFMRSLTATAKSMMDKAKKDDSLLVLVQSLGRELAAREERHSVMIIEQERKWNLKMMPEARNQVQISKFPESPEVLLEKLPEMFNKAFDPQMPALEGEEDGDNIEDISSLTGFEREDLTTMIPRSSEEHILKKVEDWIDLSTEEQMLARAIHESMELARDLAERDDVNICRYAQLEEVVQRLEPPKSLRQRTVVYERETEYERKMRLIDIETLEHEEDVDVDYANKMFHVEHDFEMINYTTPSNYSSTRSVSSASIITLGSQMTEDDSENMRFLNKVRTDLTMGKESDQLSLDILMDEPHDTRKPDVETLIPKFESVLKKGKTYRPYIEPRCYIRFSGQGSAYCNVIRGMITGQKRMVVVPYHALGDVNTMTLYKDDEAVTTYELTPVEVHQDHDWALMGIVQDDGQIAECAIGPLNEGSTVRYFYCKYNFPKENFYIGMTMRTLITPLESGAGMSGLPIMQGNMMVGMFTHKQMQQYTVGASMYNGAIMLNQIATFYKDIAQKFHFTASATTSMALHFNSSLTKRMFADERAKREQDMKTYDEKVKSRVDNDDSFKISNEIMLEAIRLRSMTKQKEILTALLSKVNEIKAWFLRWANGTPSNDEQIGVKPVFQDGWIAKMEDDFKQGKGRDANKRFKAASKDFRRVTGLSAPTSAIRTVLDVDVNLYDAYFGKNLVDMLTAMIKEMRTLSNYTTDNAGSDPAKRANRMKQAEAIRAMIADYRANQVVMENLIPMGSHDTKDGVRRYYIQDFIASYLKEGGAPSDFPDGMRYKGDPMIEIALREEERVTGLKTTITSETKIIQGQERQVTTYKREPTSLGTVGDDSPFAQEANIDRLALLCAVICTAVGVDKIKQGIISLCACLATQDKLLTANKIRMMMSDSSDENVKKTFDTIKELGIPPALEKYLITYWPTYKRIIQAASCLNAMVCSPMSLLYAPSAAALRYIVSIYIAETQEAEAGAKVDVKQSLYLLHRFLMGETPDVWTGLKTGNALMVTIRPIGVKRALAISAGDPSSASAYMKSDSNAAGTAIKTATFYTSK